MVVKCRRQWLLLLGKATRHHSGTRNSTPLIRAPTVTCSWWRRPPLPGRRGGAKHDWTLGSTPSAATTVQLHSTQLIRNLATFQCPEHGAPFKSATPPKSGATFHRAPFKSAFGGVMIPPETSHDFVLSFGGNHNPSNIRNTKNAYTMALLPSIAATTTLPLKAR